MLYRKAAVVTGVGVGLLLAIAVATINHIMAARLAGQISACPDIRCDRLVQIVESQPMHLLIAFTLGFVAAFVWTLRRDRRRQP